MNLLYNTNPFISSLHEKDFETGREVVTAVLMALRLLPLASLSDDSYRVAIEMVPRVRS